MFVACLGGSLTFLAATAVWVTRSAGHLGWQAVATQLEAYEAAYELKTGLLQLAVEFARSMSSPDPSARASFLKETTNFIERVEARRATVSPDAALALDTLGANLERTLGEVRGLLTLTNPGPAWTDRLSTMVFRPGLPRLVAADAQFTTAQQAKAESDWQSVTSELDRLRRWSLVSIVLVVVLVLWLAVFLWRDLVAPLRTRVVKSEAVIRKQAKLSALGRFAAGVAHEVRNPLNSIKARLYAQGRQLPPGSAVSEDNRVMTDEVDRLEKIVRDFLAFARPAEPAPEILRPSALLRATCELLAPEYENSGYRLTLEIREDATVKADPSQLRQVLLNLVRNAAESMPHGGPIILRSCVRPDDAGTGGASLASIEVEDRGPGIPAAVQARLFDPFFTTKEGGTGLGLSISARIVEAHSGRIECETKLNLGTVFRILLPISPNHAQSKQPDSVA